jgi:hypothetical protein
MGRRYHLALPDGVLEALALAWEGEARVLHLCRGGDPRVGDVCFAVAPPGSIHDFQASVVPARARGYGPLTTAIVRVEV